MAASAPLTEALQARVRAAFETLRSNRRAAHAALRRFLSIGPEANVGRAAETPPGPEHAPSVAERLIDHLATGDDVPGFLTIPPPLHGGVAVVDGEWKELATHPDLEPVHLLRLLRAHAGLSEDGRLTVAGLHVLRRYRATHERRPTLLALAELFVTAGWRLDARELAEIAPPMGLDDIALQGLWEPEDDVTPEEFATYFATRPQALVATLEARPESAGDVLIADRRRERRERALFLLVRAPELPPGVVDPLYRLALGGHERLRTLARGALREHHERTSRAIAALDERASRVRASAAHWLEELGDPAAMTPLRNAYAKETQETARAAMVRALGALGVDFGGDGELAFDRDGLAREAATKLKRGRPQKLGWFPWDTIPELRWRDGVPVDRRSVEWLLVQADANKSPSPTPLLRQILGELDADDARGLGDFVATSWFANDVRLPTPEDVADEVRSSLPRELRRRSAGYDAETLYEELLAQRLEEPFGSVF
ncbi:MAG: hypothetical protein AAGH15_02780, partial [Myxococcota bacterium]